MVNVARKITSRTKPAQPVRAFDTDGDAGFLHCLRGSQLRRYRHDLASRGDFDPASRLSGQGIGSGGGTSSMGYIANVCSSRLISICLFSPRVFVCSARLMRPSAGSRAMSHHHFFVGLMDPRFSLSSSFASQRAARGMCSAAQRNGASCTNPSRFQGHVFMHRPHIAPPRLVVRYCVHLAVSVPL